MEGGGDMVKIVIVTGYKTAFYSSTGNVTALCTVDTTRAQGGF